MTLPELRFNITPLGLHSESVFENNRNLYTPDSPSNLRPNEAPASPLVTLQKSISTSTGAYPDASRKRTQEKADSKLSDSEQSRSVIISDVDDDYESTSSEESKRDSSSEELRHLKKQLESANKKGHEKEAARIQREIDKRTYQFESPKSNIKSNKIHSPSSEHIDGSYPSPIGDKRNSSLQSPDKLKNLLETKERKVIIKIDESIQKLIDKEEKIIEKLRKLNAIVDDFDEVVDEDSYRSQINSLEKELRETRKEIDKLKDKSEQIERSVDPEAMSHNEMMDLITKLLSDCKSKKTLTLEKKYDEMVKELTEQNEQSSYTTAKIGVAGASAFGVSFLIGNSLPRVFNMPPLVAAFFPPFISGVFHVITATPVAKAIMPCSGTSPALAELNNNFKLRGDSWGDWWRGETNVKKYRSKDPNHVGKITIEQRLAEEKAFGVLYSRRHKDEESSYYFYTLNYSFKALGAAFLSTTLGTTSLAYRMTELIMHSICGAVSGAEYLMSQQDARSNREGSKNIPTLTREIFAAKADALRSLQTDVDNKIKEHQRQPNYDQKDTINRLHVKASRKVSDDLEIATRQAGMFGLLRHEFMELKAQGKILDTIAECLGRTISLMPVATANYYFAHLRNSSNPWEVFAGHTLSAIFLIAPPGFTARPFYIGMIRACLQMMCNIYQNKTAPVDKTVPADDHDDDNSSERVSMPSDDDSSSERVSMPSDDDSDDSSLDEFFNKGYYGNPTERDKNAGL